jgi:dTMP kinase
MKGKYIVIEGHDGVGKSTQIELLADYLRAAGQEVVVTKEPGGGLPSTDIIRKLLKNKHYDLDQVTHTLLLTANRRELWVKLIEPALKKGQTVISDRNWWSTVAFEHFGMGVPLSLVERLSRDCLPERYLKPDLGIVMTLSDEERRRRLGGRDDKSAQDSYESRGDDFQERVRNGYHEIIKKYQAAEVDAGATPEEIHQKVVNLLTD